MTVALQYSLKSGRLIPPIPFCFLMTALTLRGFLCFHEEISPEYSLEGLMLKLKLQYFGHLMRRTDSFKKTLCWERLKSGGEGDDRGWDGWRASLTQWTWVCVNPLGWWWTLRPGVLQSVGLQRVGHDWVTELNLTDYYLYFNHRWIISWEISIWPVSQGNK